jgi:hypothetical protein
MSKGIEVLRERMSRKRREGVEGEVAHLRQLDAAMEEEQERLGVHPGDVEQLDTKVIKVSRLPGRGAVIPSRKGCDSCGCGDPACCPCFCEVLT